MSLKLAVLVSGRGSNMEAIVRAATSGNLDAKVCTVLSNDANAGALSIAREYGIETSIVESFGLTRKSHEQKVVDILQPLAPDFIVLAGYMRILSPYFLSHFRHPHGYYQVINIHPSLLPAFPGKSAYEDAFKYGVKISGVTVHLVDEQVDHGAILAQQAFPRLDSDTLDSFKQRGLAVEHELYPKVLQEIALHGVPPTHHLESV